MPKLQPADDDLLLKRRARRRLLGAVAFAGLAAVILPMVMDEEPKQQVQDIQIRIPGQHQSAFTPKLGRLTKAPVSDESESRSAGKDAGKEGAGKTIQPPEEKSLEKVGQAVEESALQKIPKTPEKMLGRETGNHEKNKSEKLSQSAKTVEKKSESPTGKDEAKARAVAEQAAVKRSRAEEAQRAAAALAGKDIDSVVQEKLIAEQEKTVKRGQYVILIGAFSKAANVRQLQVKLGELGIQVLTEPIESGKKTRVRAGPFTSREAAEKAVEKMKRIGVNGVISSKS